MPSNTPTNSRSVSFAIQNNETLVFDEDNSEDNVSSPELPSSQRAGPTKPALKRSHSSLDLTVPDHRFKNVKRLKQTFKRAGMYGNFPIVSNPTTKPGADLVRIPITKWKEPLLQRTRSKQQRPTRELPAPTWEDLPINLEDSEAEKEDEAEDGPWDEPEAQDQIFWAEAQPTVRKRASARQRTRAQTSVSSKRPAFVSHKRLPALPTAAASGTKVDQGENRLQEHADGSPGQTEPTRPMRSLTYLVKHGLLKPRQQEEDVLPQQDTDEPEQPMSARQRRRTLPDHGPQRTVRWVFWNGNTSKDRRFWPDGELPSERPYVNLWGRPGRYPC